MTCGRAGDEAVAVRTWCKAASARAGARREPIAAGRGSSRHEEAASMPEERRPERLELVEETLEVGKREVERGRVAVRTRVETREEVAEVDLTREEVGVERVPVGRPVGAPPVREEDGVLIVPVLEERLVVTTELVLVEEIRMTRRSRTERVREPVTLRSERAEVERLGGRGPARQPGGRPRRWLNAP